MLPGLTMMVLTRTGWIGSSEPTAGATRGEGTALVAAQRGTWTVVVALGSDFDVSVTGTLAGGGDRIGLRRAVLASGLGSGLAGVSVNGTLAAEASA